MPPASREPIGALPPAAGPLLVTDAAGAAAEPGGAAAADLVDLGDAAAEAVAVFAAGHPGIAYCAEHSGAAVVRSPALAARTGAVLLCQGPDQARGNPLPAGRLLVPVPPGGIAAARAAGWLPLVDADLAVAGLPAAARGPGAIVAITALSGWLGAAAVRTRLVRPGRQALDMVAVIAGARPPARAVRGLA